MTIARRDWVWVALYAALVGGIVWTMQTVRDHALIELNSPQAQAEWQSWREVSARQSGKDQAGDEVPVEGPVQRRQPNVQEPPTLMLLRDHFPLMLFAALLFSSVLYAFMVIVVRGLLGPTSRK